MKNANRSTENNSSILNTLAELVNYKTRLFHKRRLLAELKLSIRTAMDSSAEMKQHFALVWKKLEANGVKDILDSGKEFDSYLWNE